MHEKGNYFTQYGSIYAKSNPGIMLDEDITIVIDIESGILMKVGKKDMVEAYFNDSVSKYVAVGFPEMQNKLKLITFKVKYEELGFAPEGYNFDIDEICTILNWFNNSIGGTKMKWFLESPLDAVKSEIKRLQGFGF
jgi:hypothetical protein